MGAYFIEKDGENLVISIEIKKKCIQLHKEGKTARQIYMDYYSQLPLDNIMQFDSFQRKLRKWKGKIEADDVLLEAGNLGYNYTPTRTTVQVNNKGEVVQAWIKSHTTDDLYLKLIDTIKELKPFEPVTKKPDEAKERMLEIKLDDLHFGHAFYEDYEETLQNVIEVIESKFFEEINIVIGEDLIHTNDFRGHTNKGTFIGEADIPRGYKDALRFYFAIIEASLKNSKTTNVIYSMGNHSESLSWTVTQVLKATYPQANYDDKLIERKAIIYKKIFIGISHCEETTGNLRDIKDIFMQEFLQAYANAEVREIHLGHKHKSQETEDINGCVVRRLPSGVPTDKYSYRHGWTGTVKRFILFEYSANKLKHNHYV